MTTAQPLVIHHGGCRDGWCAAWVAHKRFPDAEFFAGYYGQPPPFDLARGRAVYVVDFSYPLADMQALDAVADRFVLLDHHKTAREALVGWWPANGKDGKPRGYSIIDMDRSGAGLAWDYLVAGGHARAADRPWLVDYVEDRDLWRHALPYSDVVNAWIGTLPFTFEAWDRAHMDMAQDAMECGDPLRSAVAKGIAVQAKVEQYVAEVRKNARRFKFEGHDVPLVNAPQVDISELLSAMCEGETFAMGWWQRADGVFQYSFRSRGDFDVSALAKKHGGGGHKNAAGFQSEVLLG